MVLERVHEEVVEEELEVQELEDVGDFLVKEVKFVVVSVFVEGVGVLEVFGVVDDK